MPSHHRRQSSSNHDFSRQFRGIQINISSDPFQHRIPPYLQRWWQQSQWKQACLSLRLLYRRKFQDVKPWQYLLIATVIAGTCIVLMMHVGFFSGKRYQDLQQDHHRIVEEIDLLDQVFPDAGKGLATLITVLPPASQIDGNGKDTKVAVGTLDSLEPLIELACRYDMFGHWFIWVPLQYPAQIALDSLLLPSKCSLPRNQITIHKATVDAKAAARYFACGMAPTPYCYFQDPDLTMGTRHMRSVYANFLRSSSVIHGETLSMAHYCSTQWSWCFYNESAELHACFSPPGLGIFVTKEKTEHFLHQLEMNPVEPAHADYYFTLWMNQGRAQLLQGELDTNHSLVIDLEPLEPGLIGLYNSLIEHQDIAAPPDSFDTRAACHNDRCVFLTNIDVLPRFDLFTFVPGFMTASESIRLRNDYYFHGYPGSQYFHAVDHSDDTMWTTAKSVAQGDYFGLDLLMPLRIPMKYRVLVDHPYSYYRNAQPQISFDGTIWMNLDSSMTCNPLNSLLECFITSQHTGYRYIRLINRFDLGHRFKVHDFSLVSKTRRNKQGQLLDILAED